MRQNQEPARNAPLSKIGRVLVRAHKQRTMVCLSAHFPGYGRRDGRERHELGLTVAHAIETMQLRKSVRRLQQSHLTLFPQGNQRTSGFARITSRQMAMKTKSAPQSAFFNPRVLIGFVLCSISVSLA